MFIPHASPNDSQSSRPAKQSSTTELILAAEMGATIRTIVLAAEGIPLEAQDASGETALIKACKSSNWDCFDRLVEAGADLNACSQDGRSAIEYLKHAHVEELARSPTSRLLDFNVTGNDLCGHLPGTFAERVAFHFSHSAKKARIENIELLLSKFDLNDLCLSNAIKNSLLADTVETLKFLLNIYSTAQKANDNAFLEGLLIADNGLHNTASIALIEWLAQRGDVRSIRGPGGENLLALAAASSNFHLEQHLLKFDFNLDERNSDGCTALHLASSTGSTAVIRDLVQAGADVEANDKDGATPLFYACKKTDRLDAARELIQLGARVNAQNNNQSTPLHFAASFNLPAHVNELLASGADLNMANSFSMIPLHCASEVAGC